MAAALIKFERQILYADVFVIIVEFRNPFAVFADLVVAAGVDVNRQVFVEFLRVLLGIKAFETDEKPFVKIG